MGSHVAFVKYCIHHFRRRTCL